MAGLGGAGRRFHWAEDEWVRFCASRGWSIEECANSMRGRPKASVASRAITLNVKFHATQCGPKTDHATGRPFNSETGRAHAERRWHDD